MRQAPSACVPTGCVKEDSPMKRGLKCRTSVRRLASYAVKEDSPMKRGLKCQPMSTCRPTAWVKEDSPMKRGLKCAEPMGPGRQNAR